MNITHALNKIVTLRITSDLYDLSQSVNKARGEDMASFGRRAILKSLAELSYLSDDQKKALGVEIPENNSQEGA